MAFIDVFMSQDSETHKHEVSHMTKKCPHYFPTAAIFVPPSWISNLYKTDSVKADEENRTDVKRVKFIAK